MGCAHGIVAETGVIGLTTAALLSGAGDADVVLQPVGLPRGGCAGVGHAFGGLGIPQKIACLVRKTLLYLY